ncbi:MAG: class I SAM-dependent methyltransferase [Thermodesulfobacteriota bacterium]
MEDDRTTEEEQFLNHKVDTYVTSDSPQDRLIRRLAVRTFAPFMEKTGRALELGCSDGYMTSLIAPLVNHVDVVDGSTRFLEIARSRNIPNATFIHTLFENFEAALPYDYVFATYVLEHVTDVSSVLRVIRSAMKPESLLFVVVPNARAVSRQLALHMGLISDLKCLTDNDVRHGHRRVYDRVSLNKDLAEGGLLTVAQGGILFKPFADFQMDKLIEHEIVQEPQIEGLYSLGFEYPDLCGCLYSICKRGPHGSPSH